MKAIVVDEPKKASIHDVDKPKIRPDYIIVKVKAVALNPTDWKHIDYISDKGAISGCDFAGIVDEIGSDVKASVKKGDRVYGVSHGGNVSNHEDGAFAEYAVCKDGLFTHIPANLSLEDTATLPVGVGTVGQGLYQSLGLPLPDGPKPKTPFPVLIYGGSSATGTLAIQFAALSGLHVVTTASPRNHEMLRALGAQTCFDYNDPDCGQKIREATGNSLRYVFDTITTDDSKKIAAEALSSHTSEGELYYSGLLSFKEFPRDDVKFRHTMLYTALGEEYTKLDRTVKPPASDYAFFKNWLLVAGPLIADGKIKPHPKEVGKGLEGVLEGLDRMRKGEYSAKKLVYTID